MNATDHLSQSPLLWIPAVTALVAVVLGPLVSIYVARRQALLQAVVLDRRDQLRELRRAFAEFVAIIIISNSRRALQVLKEPEAAEKMQKAMQLETEISLMLDARVEDHRIVRENMTDARNRVFTDDPTLFDPRKYLKHYNDASYAMTRILLAERAKVLKLR